MNIDNSKENIQPLVGGRDFRILQVALNADDNLELQKELQRQRSEYEESIVNYKGDDPLELWFDYITWVEQSYPKCGKQSAFDDLLVKCISHFCTNEKYFQDRRMIKLYIKYIDSQQNPVEFYQELYNSGIGTMVADLYICWAYYYDINDNFQKANEIFRKGIDAKAQPFDELDQSHKIFGFTMSQRMLNKDENMKRDFITNMEQKRNAFTSLKAYKHKYVGSVRTGNVIKSNQPGKIAIQQERGNNENINVFEVHKEGEVDELLLPHGGNTIMKNIADKIRHQENEKEPGPWSNAKNTKIHGDQRHVIPKDSSTLGFKILEDTEEVSIPEKINRTKNAIGVTLPINFIKKNLKQAPFETSLIIPDTLKINTIPMYDKFFAYPGNNCDYCLEEIHAYKWFQKQGIQNKFTLGKDKIWSDGINSKIRLPPDFIRKNLKQEVADFPIFQTDINEKNFEFCFKFKKVYPIDALMEFSPEEILKETRKSIVNRKKGDKTILMEDSMEETIITTRPIQSFEIFVDEEKSNDGKIEAGTIWNFKEVKNETKEKIKVERKPDQILFARPHDVQPKKQQPISKFNFFEDDVPDDTCTTIQFNHFIRSEIASTPISKKSQSLKQPLIKNNILSPTELNDRNLATKNVTSNNAVLDKTDNEIKNYSSPPDGINGNCMSRNGSDQPFIPKSLSTIMEISETNTGSSGASTITTYTKSSGDTQNSDYEHDNSMKFFTKHSISKQQQLSTINETSAGTLPTNIIEDKLDDYDELKQFIVGSEKLEDLLLPPTLKSFNQSIEKISKPIKENEYDTNFMCNLFSKTPEKKTTSFNVLPMETSLKKNPHLFQRSTTVFPNLNDSVTLPSFLNYNPKQKQPKNEDKYIDSTVHDVNKSILPEYKSFLSYDKNDFFNKMDDSFKNITNKNLSVLPNLSININQIMNDDHKNEVPNISRKLTDIISSPIKDSNEKFEIFMSPLIEKKMFQTINTKEIMKQTSVGKSEGLERFTLPLNHSPLPNKIVFKTSFKKEKNCEEVDDEHLKSVEKDVFPTVLSVVKSEGLERFTLPLNHSPLPNKIVFKKEKNCEEVNEEHLKSVEKDVFPTVLSVGKTEGLERFTLPLNLSPISKTTEKNDDEVEEHLKSVEKDLFPTQFSIFHDSMMPTEMKEPIKLSTSTSIESKIPIPIKKLKLNQSAESASNPNFSFLTKFNAMSLNNEKPLNTRKNIENEVDAIENSNHSSKFVESNDISILDKFLEISKRCDSPIIIHNENENNIIHQKHITKSKSINNYDEIDYHNENTIYLERNDNILIENDAADEDWNDYEQDNKHNHPYKTIDLNQTKQFIDEIQTKPMELNPFDLTLCEAFLDDIEFYKYLNELNNCIFVDHIEKLKKNKHFKINDEEFNVIKLIGRGNYGSIFSAKSSKSGKMYALKQEKPANLWEYYISIVITDRIVNTDILPCFMTIEYGLIGNNASILVSDFVEYGTLIDVNNIIKQTTTRNIDEIIVIFLACEILSIIDHLHACNIIHGDIKPDNFMLMSKLSFASDRPILKLIDFGSAIDMTLFNPGTTFNVKLETKNFICPEMLDNRPWTYQTDLFCIAATIHVLLFGRYMEIVKKGRLWNMTSRLPRYFNIFVWNTIIENLINIPNCNSLPNLQELKSMLKESIMTKPEYYVKEKINEFNSAF